MRVLAVNHTSSLGGAERALLDQAARDSDAGVSETVIACPPGDLARMARQRGLAVTPIAPFEFGLKLAVRDLPRQVAGALKSAWSIRRAIRGSDVDVVHANTTRAALVSSLALVGARVPLVVHLHDCLPDTRASRYVQLLIKFAADAVVANSDYTGAHFESVSGVRPVTVYNAFASDGLEVNSENVAAERDSLLDGAPGPLIGMTAQITPWKGQDMAIAAFAALADEFPGAVLVIGGSVKFENTGSRFDNAEYLESLHSSVRELGLGERVRFTGEVPDPYLRAKCLDVLLMPSWEEPLGRAAIEAMALGTPVISTSVGGPPEFIVDGETGLLADPRLRDEWTRALRRLLSDPESAAAIAAAANNAVIARFFGSTDETDIARVFRGVLR